MRTLTRPAKPAHRGGPAPGAAWSPWRLTHPRSSGFLRTRATPFPTPATPLDRSHPRHPLEREAHRVADRVLRMPGGEPAGDTASELREAAPLDRGGLREAIPSTGAGRSTTAGRPLDAGARRFMESRFGYDFSRVRIHTDRRAAASAHVAGARAFTQGRDIGFAEGEYRPGTPSGRRLLAHELTHVIQQSGSGAGRGASSHAGVGQLPSLRAPPGMPQFERLTIKSKPPVSRREAGPYLTYSTAGHAFVELARDPDDPAERPVAWGFYAAWEGDPTPPAGVVLATGFGRPVPGEVRDDRSSTWAARRDHEIDGAAFQRALAEVAEWRRATPDYRLFSRNCVHFVRAVAGRAGVTVPDLPGVDEPSDLVRHLLQTGGEREAHLQEREEARRRGVEEAERRGGPGPPFIGKL